ncbi:hypothetical protein NEOLEDRAFT_1240354 [Neolentinus lepideus HHB14362 ss-1]|uniref:FCH-domain-containing protein n=1 Tax=Neolentinus lepideus HHB14362 ss-1 TaxID=1314782 RepID=A0A165TZL1_9AGAM|nr:hypothetical protein NEOLEDRAFT_1240354 [Neolentinus lepideus HHB14362 ss-1]
MNSATTNSNQSYGSNLPDQVDLIADLSDTQFELLNDLRELYRDRVALERDYAVKLQALAAKASERKSKNIASLVLGNEPTKAWDETVLQRSTLNVAYEQLISSFSDSAQDHVNLADNLSSRVTDALKTSERKHADLKKKQMQFFQKLLSERDRVYSERSKNKQNYDEECMDLESYRQKQDRAQADRHADRAARQYEQQQNDMLNSKNTYLVSIDTANKVKAKFYSGDLPLLQDQFQNLQTQLLNQFVAILSQAQDLHMAHLDSLKGRVSKVQDSLAKVDAKQDQDLFIDYNIRPFAPPADWTFEPCKSHYDTGDVSVESGPKVFLQNKLSKSRAKLQELAPLLESKRDEVARFFQLFASYTGDRSLGNTEEISDDYLDAQHQLTFYETSACILQAEIDTISSALEGDEGAQKPHSFKNSSFSIPTQCGYCKSSIWGLSKQGKTCRLCGLSVHSKCELKVPAECTGSKEGRHRSSASISRISIDNSRNDAPQTPTASSFVKSDVSAHAETKYLRAKIIFDFLATSPFELSVTEGVTVQVLEDDDGSGWVKVGDEAGGTGLVPASYIAYIDSSYEAGPHPNAAVSAGDPRKYAKGVYDYEAQGADEISVHAGGLIELTAGPSGGQNYAEGWWEGIDTTGKRGIFPSNYVELV